MEKALKFLRIHRLPIDLAALLMNLNERYWWLFSSNKVIYMLERNITLCVGYYEGIGAQAKKKDLTPVIVEACEKLGYVYHAYNDAKRGGVKGQKVKVFF